jgi:hypothetical protein
MCSNTGAGVDVLMDEAQQQKEQKAPAAKPPATVAAAAGAVHGMGVKPVIAKRLGLHPIQNRLL